MTERRQNVRVGVLEERFHYSYIAEAMLNDWLEKLKYVLAGIEGYAVGFPTDGAQQIRHQWVELWYIGPQRLVL